jgi:hypothetical protein
MEISSGIFKHLLDLTRSNCENATIDPLAGIEYEALRFLFPGPIFFVMVTVHLVGCL